MPLPSAGFNPQLCRELTKELAALSKARNKQALITTHNPAVLDGLDLHDDEQRLFVVYRNDEGHTVTRRVKVKPSTGATKYKLSELWMRGHLGGLPKHFPVPPRRTRRAWESTSSTRS